MTLYVDSSAFAKRYLADEDQHELCMQLMEDDPVWVTSRVSLVEVHRAVRAALPLSSSVTAAQAIDADFMEAALIDVDTTTIAMALQVAVQTQARSLDAIHLASALRTNDTRIEFLTFDAQQARSARQLGLRVVGATG